MAKKQAIDEENTGGKICPSCGKRCMYFKQWTGGNFISTHTIGSKEVVGSNGIKYTIKTRGDCCNESGPMPYNV